MIEFFIELQWLSSYFNLFVEFLEQKVEKRFNAGNTKGGSITVPLTSCLTGLD
jgi:hypothetical protein